MSDKKAAPLADAGYRAILRMAWPIVLANIATPLLGLVDTAVIGHRGTTRALAAIALGALLFNFLYWGFNFLRMVTTGFTAQAHGAGDSAEVRAFLARGLMLAFVLGGLLCLLQSPITELGLRALAASDDTRAIAADYVRLRIWSAPAALGQYVVLGCLIGLGRSRDLMVIQLALNLLNLVLDLWFAGVRGMGAPGVALGTLIAEWAALLLGLWICLSRLRRERSDDEPFWPWARIRDLRRGRALLAANTDIGLRTFAMLLGFGWFTRVSSQFGDTVLAANHVLNQFVTFSAYFLDGFAFAAEALVGRAIGARNAALFDLAVRRSTILALMTAALLSLVVIGLGPAVVGQLTDLQDVQAVAVRFLPWAGAYVLLSFAAFQLDGMFVGATRTADMRNAAWIAVGGFLLAAQLLVPDFGNQGLWLAFCLYVVLRAVLLAPRLRTLRSTVFAPA